MYSLWILPKWVGFFLPDRILVRIRDFMQYRENPDQIGMVGQSSLCEKKTKELNINPFAPGDFAKKRALKLVEWFSGHCRAIKS